MKNIKCLFCGAAARDAGRKSTGATGHAGETVTYERRSSPSHGLFTRSYVAYWNGAPASGAANTTLSPANSLDMPSLVLPLGALDQNKSLQAGQLQVPDPASPQAARALHLVPLTKPKHTQPSPAAGSNQENLPRQLCNAHLSIIEVRGKALLLAAVP